MTTATASVKPLDLATIHMPLQALQAVEIELCQHLLEREDAVRAGLLALLTRQHLVLIGPPGTAKSLLVTELAKRICPATGGGLSSFVWLMTRFTTPEEIFGPISVAGLKVDQYRRLTAGKLPEAELVFLDEVFKANSAVLNALLTILNERLFDNGPQRVRVPLISLFGASNEMPQGDDLGALWDRFALRLIVEFTSDGAFGRLMRLSPPPALPTTLTQADLAQLQGAVTQIPVPDGIIDALGNLRKELIGKGITASDRRWRQTLHLLQAHALLEGRGFVEEDDLIVLRDALWTSPEQRQDIARIAAKLANPLNAKAVELGDQAESVHRSAMDAQRTNGENEEAKMQAAVEANGKLKGIANQLKRLKETAESQGRSTTRIAKVIDQLARHRREIVDLINE